ncbi:MAG: GNAT family N-acetyltransferase [Bacteroidia bacterium]
MQHIIKWNIKHFNTLSALEYHHILALRTSIFVIEQDCPYQEMDEKDLHSYHVFGSIDGQVVAVVRIVPAGISYEEISIGRVAVLKKLRGTNVGNDLMNKSIEFVSQTFENQSIRISAQEHLKSFYERFNFKKQSEMYLEDGIPHIEMLRLSK